MTLKAKLGTACAVAALIGMSGAAYADGNGGYTRTYGKDKVEIYVSVKSGAYADIDYQTKHRGPPRQTEVFTTLEQPVPYPHYSKKPQIKEETAVAWGQVKKVKIEAEGVTSGTWDAHYSSEATTHGKSQTSNGGGGGPTASSSPSNGEGGCGCSSSSSNTSASASGGTSGSWSTGN